MRFQRDLLSSTALRCAGAVMLSTAFLVDNAFANPQGGQVVGGSASISQVSPNQLDITQTSGRAVINWQSFSIGANETTQFIQPNSSSVAVNRVTGVDPSQILGRLTANGQVVLVNPNGILFGKGARVDVGGLVASTSGITTANAIAGRMIFDQGGNAGATIENDGRITARTGGLVALVAPSVVNNGVIQAKLGKVSLASGDKWTLDLYGDNLVSFDVTDQVKGSVTNTGTIKAGSVAITANAAKGIVGNAINMGGVVEASSVHNEGGTIVLDGGDNGNVTVTGTLKATGQGTNAVGGSIEVTGNDVALDGATVDASGTNGGGTIEIGGGAHGGGSLHHAANVTVDATTKLLTDALLSGDGGSITVWSDGDTKFYGSASAKGGFSFGNGGQIETSGHTLTADPAKIDTSAANGTTGNWLLDPYDLSINAAGASAIDTALASSNVTVQTTAVTSGTSGTSSYGSVISGVGGNISVNSAISWSSANSLTLSAYNSILVNANISDSAAGNVVLRADNAGRDSGSVTNSATISTGGAVSLYYNPSGGYASPSTFTGITGTGGVTSYMLVNNASDLANVNNNLTATYALGANIAAVGTFAGIGSSATAFSGIFDGNGGLGTNYSIGGATISGTTDVGLFNNNSGTIRNVTVTSEMVTGASAAANVGGLAGYNSGTIANSSFAGSVIAGVSAVAVGGIVGNDSGVLSHVSATGFISAGTASSYIGGIAGTETGSVSNIYGGATVEAGASGQNIGEAFGDYEGVTLSGVVAAGTVSAGSAAVYVGGLAGQLGGALNDATISTQIIVGNNSLYVGGIAGVIGGGAPANPFAAGSTIAFSGSILAGAATDYVGGLIGDLFGTTITGGTVSGFISAGSGSQYIGGLVGDNDYFGLVTGGTVLASATIEASASTAIGGLVGYDNSISTLTNASSSATVIGIGASSAVGGAVGFNNASLGTGNPGGSVSGVTIAGSVQAGAGSTGVGGIVGINGIDPSYSGQADQPPSVTGNTSSASVSVGTNSFAVGGIVGWNQSWTNPNNGTVYSGVVSGNSGFGAVTAGVGSTYVHGATQIGCDQTAGCAGTAGTQAITITANAVSTTYGTAVALTYNGAGTLESGDTYSSIVTGALTAGTAAGTYTIGQGSLALASPYASLDYTLTYVTATETVAKAHLTITPTGSQVYGGTSAVVSYNYNGLVNGDASGVVSGVSYTTPVTSSSPLGTYGITATGGTASNYTITDATGVYTVTKGYLTITPAGSQTYGGANATVSYTYTGLANGDNSSIVSGVTYSTPATTASNIGTYSLTAVGGTASNYTIVDASGNYIVNKAALTITPNGSQTYGGANATTSYTYSGLVNGNTSSVVTGVSSTTTVVSSSSAGAYGITATGGTASNYTITDATGVYTVNKALLTVTPNGSQSYGGANVTVSYTYNGLVNGNTSSVVSGISYTTSVTSNSNAGAYSDMATGGTATNYTIVDGSGIYTVNKVALTITPTGSQTFGGTNVSVSYTYNGLVNGNTSSVVSGISFTSTATSSSNAGAYSDTATGGTATNYTITDGTGVYTVNKAALTITANGSQTYGGANAGVSYTYTGLVNGNTSGVVSGVGNTTNVTNSSSAGTYGVTATGGTASNYTITDATGTYIVSKALLTVTPTGSQTYGGANASVTYAYTGLLNGDNSSVASGVGYTSTATSASNAGTYTATASGGTAANYTIVDASGAYVVNKAALTITAGGSQTYGGSNFALSYSYAGLVNGDTSSAISGVSYTSTATSTSNAGAYSATATGGTASNYTITDASGVFTVNKAPLTITPTGMQIYGGTSVNVSYAYAGLVNGDASGVVSGVSYTTPVTSSSGYGTYAVTATGGTASNYTITDATGVYTVSKGYLTITPTGSQTFGGSNIAVSYSYSGLVNGDTSSIVSGVSYTASANSASNAGAYTVTAVGGTASEYTVIDATGVYTVNKAALTITPTGTQTYGGANAGVSYTYTGLVNGNTSSVVSGVSYTTPVTNSSNAGGYAITATGGTAGNYTITDATGVYTVGKAALTVTPTGSQTYGGANAGVSYSYAGLVNGDTSAAVTGISYTTPVTSSSSAGTYTDTATGGTATNYTITDASGVYTVNKAALTITATGSQTYGGSNIAVSYAYNGLVNGDTSSAISGLSYTSTATSSSNAGNYSITATGSNSNYTITDTAGVYTVNKAPLTVTPTGYQILGGTDVTISYAYNGLLNGNTSSVVSGVSYTTPVTSNTALGTYSITATGGTASNYTITDATGVYSVYKGIITITPTGSQTYGGSNVAVSYAYAGLTGGDTSSIVTGAGYTTNATSASNAGAYSITATGGSAPQYGIVDASGVYTINKAALTITPVGSQTYGGSNIAVSYVYNGLVNGDTGSAISGLGYTTTATSSSNAGAYSATATGGASPNYTITDLTGAYTVNDAVLVITPGSVVRQVNQFDPAFTATYSGLVNGDTSSIVTGLSLSSTDQFNSAPGAYQITGMGASAPNYTIIYQPSLLVVLGAPPSPSSTATTVNQTTGSATLAQVVDDQILQSPLLLTISQQFSQNMITSPLMLQSVTAFENQPFANRFEQYQQDQMICLTGLTEASCSGPLVIRGY